MWTMAKTYAEILNVVEAEVIAEKVEKSILQHAAMAVSGLWVSRVAYRMSLSVLVSHS